MPTHRFYAALAELGHVVAQSGGEMRGLLRSLEEPGDHVRTIDELCDTCQPRGIALPGAGALVGPFDRSDVADLGQRLDGIVQRLQDVAQFATVTGLRRSLTDVGTIGDYVAESTAELGALAAGLLTATADDEAFERIHQIERSMRRAYNVALSTLFQADGEELQVIKEKEVLDRVNAVVRDVAGAAAVVHRLLATRT